MATFLLVSWIHDQPLSFSVVTPDMLVDTQLRTKIHLLQNVIVEFKLQDGEHEGEIIGVGDDYSRLWNDATKMTKEANARWLTESKLVTCHGKRQRKPKQMRDYVTNNPKNRTAQVIGRKNGLLGNVRRLGQTAQKASATIQKITSVLNTMPVDPPKLPKTMQASRSVDTTSVYDTRAMDDIFDLAPPPRSTVQLTEVGDLNVTPYTPGCDLASLLTPVQSAQLCNLDIQENNSKNTGIQDVESPTKFRLRSELELTKAKLTAISEKFSIVEGERDKLLGIQQNSVSLGPGLVLDKNLLTIAERAAKGSGTKLARNLLPLFFSGDELKTSSVSGKTSNGNNRQPNPSEPLPALCPIKLGGIIDYCLKIEPLWGTEPDISNTSSEYLKSWRKNRQKAIKEIRHSIADYLWNLRSNSLSKP